MQDRDWQAEIRLLQQRESKSQMILGLAPSAGSAEIRRAFGRLSRANRPDTRPNNPNAARRFQLICSAYKFLTEGKSCAVLDQLEPPEQPANPGGYRLDNPWGYWCWWRDKFFQGQP